MGFLQKQGKYPVKPDFERNYCENFRVLVFDPPPPLPGLPLMRVSAIVDQFLRLDIRVGRVLKVTMAV